MRIGKKKDFIDKYQRGIFVCSSGINIYFFYAHVLNRNSCEIFTRVTSLCVDEFFSHFYNPAK